MKPDKLEPKHYQDAINVQDACNLSGVLLSLADLVPAIWSDVNKAGHGTDGFNKHPIVKLFVYKLFSLAFTEPLIHEIWHEWDVAYLECKAKSQQEGGETNGDGAQANKP